MAAGIYIVEVFLSVVGVEDCRTNETRQPNTHGVMKQQLWWTE